MANITLSRMYVLPLRVTADNLALDILGSERIDESSIIPAGTAAIGLYDLGCFQLLLRSAWSTHSTKQDYRTDHGGACFEDGQSAGSLSFRDHQKAVQQFRLSRSVSQWLA